MASTQVTIKLFVDQYNLMMACLEDQMEAEEELAQREEASAEDRSAAQQRCFQIEGLIRQLK